MIRPWPMQEAKNRLSELVDRALAEGPQLISRRGTDTVVVLSIEEFKRLRGQGTNLVEFFAASPLAEVELDMARDKDTGRGIEL